VNSSGRGLLLDADTRRLVHKLARDYGVLSVQSGVAHCPDCNRDATHTI
jgi:hypothetical protein